MPQKKASSQPEEILRGVGGSPGLAYAAVYLVSADESPFVERLLKSSEIPREIARFKKAVRETRLQIDLIQKSLRGAVGTYDADIFDMHKMVLEDGAFFEETIRKIKQDRLNAEAVVRSVTNRYCEILSAVEDDYLRERVADVRDVVRRVIRVLTGVKHHALDGLSSKSIVVAADLSPSDTATLRRDLVPVSYTHLTLPTKRIV